jgi:hypothetical protein
VPGSTPNRSAILRTPGRLCEIFGQLKRLGEDTRREARFDDNESVHCSLPFPTDLILCYSQNMTFSLTPFPSGKTASMKWHDQIPLIRQEMSIDSDTGSPRQ